MLAVEKVDLANKAQIRRFVKIPYRLYAKCPQWVPPLFIDAYMYLNKEKHPFYEHSEAEFFIAVRDGFSSFDGYGLQIEGFEHRQMMNMMNYNYPYHPKLVENLGFTKEV